MRINLAKVVMNLIVTEADLRANWYKDKKTMIKIPPGSVITPPAREFLKNKGISVEIEGEGILDFTGLTYNSSIHSAKAVPAAPPVSGINAVPASRPAPGINGGSAGRSASHEKPVPVSPQPHGLQEKKTEYMTHLRGNQLVLKSNPIIRFRGELDSFLSQLVETQLWFQEKGFTGMAEKLEEVVVFARNLMQAEVGNKEFVFPKVFGFGQAELREVSHNPMKYFGVNHSFVSRKHGISVAKLHVLRAKSREVELAAIAAFVSKEGKCEREDLITGCNRLSSILYILVCMEKARIRDEAAQVTVFEVNIGVSNRHVHLSREDLEALFGKGYELKKIKDLSQPGQFAAEETVTLQGPKGIIEKVRILGPVRKESQVELSVSDSIKLGIQAPVRDSGDVEGTPGIILTSQKNKLEMKKGVIIAKRHLHLDPGTAKKMGLQDKDLINVSLKTKRPIRLDQVAVRVSDAYKTDLHIDLDEANAAQAKNGDKAVLIWEA